MNTEWHIGKVWLDVDDFITTIEYRIRYTHNDFPGQEVYHAGSLDISSLRMPGNSSKSDLIRGLTIRLSEDTLNIIAAHQYEQLRYEYNLKSGKVRLIDDETDPHDIKVNQERDRRLAEFVFEGRKIQTQPNDIVNINLAATAALSQPDKLSDTRWHGDEKPFMWIAADNTPIILTGDKLLQLVRELALYRSTITLAAVKLKRMETLPEDFTTNDDYWK